MKNNFWISGPKLPRPSGQSGYVSDKNFPLLLVGGCTDCHIFMKFELHNDIMSYNPELNTFEILPGRLNEARGEMASSIIYVES